MRQEATGPLFADDNPDNQVGGGTAKDPNTRDSPVNPPKK